MDARQVIKNSYLFRGCNSLELIKLTEIARREFMSKGDVIISEGDDFDADTALYIIGSGLVKVAIPLGEGREMVLSILGPADQFGELSFTDGKPRSANVVAMDDTELLKLDHDHLTALFEDDHNLALKFYHSLSRALTVRVRETNDKILKSCDRLRH